MIQTLLHRTSCKIALCIALCLCCLMQLQPAMAQNKDSKGKDFWLMFNHNNSTPTITLFITSSVNTSGKVEIPGLSFSQNFTVTANTVTSVVLPPAVATHTNNVIDNKGVHVTSVDEVTVYGLNYVPFTTDAYLGLPTDALGTDYIVLTYKNSLVLGVQLGIVSTADNNVVTITPSVTTLTRTAGVPYNITLNKGQSYELTNQTSTGDLTGTIIKSTQPIGVYGGHQCGNVPGNAVYCDHLVEMLPPTSTWGTKFGTVPLKSRTNGDTWRFLASENNTVVTINGVAQPAINRGQFVEKILTTQSVIESSKPVLVCQYANGSGFSANPGDPFMMLIPPLEQFLAGYTVTTVSGYVAHYINIVAPKSIVGTLTMDGVVVNASEFTPIGTTGFYGAQLKVNPGSHTLLGSLPFGVFIYGFNNDDSYGYPGGQSFSEVAIVKTLAISPKTGTGNINVQQCFNATVKDQFNNPVTDIRVDFNIKGKNPGSSGFAITNASGVAQFCYKGPLAGKDTIVATVGALTDAAIFTWTEENVCNLSVTASTVNAHDNNSDGSAKIVVTGGTGPYTFTLNGASNITGIFSALLAGNYNFTIKDAKNCTASGSVVIMKTVTPPPVTNTVGCPKDTTYQADPVTCMATVTWAEPGKAFPDTIKLPGAYNEPNSKLMYKGSYNGHGYYQSNGFYLWPTASNLAMGKGGHLVTITTQGESDFVLTNLKQGQVYGPWIGLYNTGELGKFAWVTGEPLSFTNWYPTEPNNKGGKIDSIAENYVHLWGYDPMNRWNDLTRLYYLPFIAEFDAPVLTYRQIKGPANGSALTPGVYNICYEIWNNADKTKDTCCFNIKVECVRAGESCPGDTTIMANPATCKAVLQWSIPNAKWPKSIPIADGLFTKNNKLDLKAVYNDHAYYATDGAYRWTEARDISANMKGHLLTINSVGESNMVFSNFKKANAYAPWIGLYNTGTVGSFAWVTGEPLNFTNWFPTEPNNKGGNGNLIIEPYVLLNGYDFWARWNDMPRTTLAGFVTEYELPLLKFRQRSGPIFGTEVDTGTYTICYDITDSSTNLTTSCCFNIHVTCAENLKKVNSISPAMVTSKLPVVTEDKPQLFKATAVPNPSVTNFKIRVASQNSVQRVSVQVVDVSGRIVEVQNNVVPNSIITLGDTYRRGVYFIQVIQGSKKEIIKVVKE